MRNVDELKGSLKTMSSYFTMFSVFVWMSLFVLWAFPNHESLITGSDSEDARLPQWTQNAEDLYAPLLFVVYPQDYGDGGRCATFGLKFVSFLIGFCVPSALYLLLVVCFEIRDGIFILLKTIWDMSLLLYLLSGSFLLWWAWLF